jgi:hypothetical protein
MARRKVEIPAQRAHDEALPVFQHVDFGRASRHIQTMGQSPVDAVVRSLLSLAGVGHVQEITSEARVLGNPVPAPSIRRLLQQYSSDAVWGKSLKPAGLADLFYSVEGVNTRSGFWGLRFFDVVRPEAYPVETFNRPYDKLFNRLDTPLGPSPRGIAYRFGRVHAIQVGFAPGSPYPDRLLPNGHIEHIGEGRGPIQTATGGNAGMLEAEQRQYPIPVYQSLGSKGSKKYALLGEYRVVSHDVRGVALSGDRQESKVFVFYLEPHKLRVR